MMFWQDISSFGLIEELLVTTILGVEYIYDVFFKIPTSSPSEINSFNYEYI